MTQRIALCGGVYSNYLALQSALEDAQARGITEYYCLGDLGAFGPHPDRVFPLLSRYNVQCIQGNYDDSIGNNKDNCQCGYTDQRDNYYAQISYDYTKQNTSPENKAFLRDLPRTRTIEIEDVRILLCHGSPRSLNEFLWETTTPDHFLESFFDEYQVDVIASTHTGIKWQRRLNAGLFVNVGVLGRPENDGTHRVWYTIVEVSGNQASAQFIPIHYDYRQLAADMHEQQLPAEFIETIETGWWTTCLEMLPQKERYAGKH
ncbi:MAG: metallophosphoesterase family protein [Planctomycetota bacterium]|nr:metallophosphoesterase family protein [Planctomycetota bacterium]